jgi:hypothetical protein
MPANYELHQNVNIAFGHFPYMLKRTCVEIIQFIELFVKYDIINAQTDTGFAEQLRWESMVESYLEKTHSYVDKQRKVYSNVCDELGINLDVERDAIVLPISIEHAIVTKLRRAHHHSALMVTRFSMRGDANNMAQPMPSIMYWVSEEYTATEEEYLQTLYRDLENAPVRLFTSHYE